MKVKIKITKSTQFKSGEIIEVDLKKTIKGIVFDHGEKTHSTIHWLSDSENEFQFLVEDQKPTLTECVSRMKEIIG